jgi:Mn-dependent DtxR family transcriptional regulator
MPSVQRHRNFDEEAVEKHRYAFLESVYLLTGPDCENPVSPAELEIELGASPDTQQSVVHDLVRLGYLTQEDDGGLCLTARAVEFLQRDAWRRRSIRD